MKILKRIIVAAILCIALASLSVLAVSADTVGGLEALENGLQSQALRVVGNVVVPILIFIDVVVFLFNFVGLLRHRKGGEDYSSNIAALAITVAVGILLSLWNTWGPAMLS